MTVFEQLADAKEAVGKARRLLAAPCPDSLWESAFYLEQAVSRVRMMAASLGKASGDNSRRLTGEFQEFRNELQVTGALLGQLGGYFAARTAATYSSDGKFDLPVLPREPRELLRA